jgi:triosephosphate isomerase (TIM)
MRTKLIAGNWKMNLTLPEAEALARDLVKRIGGVTDVKIAVAPNFTVLIPVGAILAGSSIRLAAQNVHFEKKGAFTGETSAPMLAAAGAVYVIIGHSERRTLFGETDDLINKKVTAALGESIAPIFCVGETLKEREAGKAEEVVRRQVTGGLSGIDRQAVGRVVIAYEPVWAIGTGVTASPDQAQQMHGFIRGLMETKYDKTVANSLEILYGGSVTPDNVDALMAMPDIDGALVGGASLKVDSFERIVNFTR